MLLLLYLLEIHHHSTLALNFRTTFHHFLMLFYSNCVYISIVFQEENLENSEFSGLKPNKRSFLFFFRKNQIVHASLTADSALCGERRFMGNPKCF